jgi:hypothetical protein
MAVGSGLSAQIGIKKEAVYGTPVTVDKFYEFRTENFVLDKDYLQSTQLRAGRAYPSSSRRTPTTRRATGSVTMEVPNKLFGSILDLAHDDVVTPVQQGATAAYLQTHDIAVGSQTKSATIQIGKPDSSGVVQPFTGVGSVLTNWTLDCDLGEFLTSQLTFDVRDLVNTEALATAAYPAGLGGYNFAQGLVTIDGTPQTGVGVRGFTINGGQGFKVDRFGLNRTGLKGRPIPNAYAAGEGVLRMEYDSPEHYNRFLNNTRVTVILEFVGSLIASTYYETMRITLSSVGWEGATPVVDGPDVVDHEMQMRILDDGVNPPIKIEVTSTDLTV